MTTQLTRRGILKALGIGTLALAAEPILEPARKLWFVGSNAPVGSRIEQLGTPIVDRHIARTWSLKLQITEDDLFDPRHDEIEAARAKLMHAMYAEQRRAFNALFPLPQPTEWQFLNGTTIQFGDDDNYYDYDHLPIEQVLS